ncbi:Nucleoporin [Zancudomyces culisetae]|uniref:Nucleoporin n=1 Tax=Zancudomyces culisetae TaxID=1213189 RepID=A0A1R1PJQ6_ZANCU|nr:Nucleoporin [Zancudomyces culisetae]|eukprot:OMH81205.1 Nucleoporin [Zancudomyces culisetae]
MNKELEELQKAKIEESRRASKEKEEAEIKLGKSRREIESKKEEIEYYCEERNKDKEKIRKLSGELAELKRESVEKEEQFKAEMRAQKHYVAMCEKAIEEGNKRLKELEDMVTQIGKARVEEQQKTSAIIEEAQKELQEWKQGQRQQQKQQQEMMHVEGAGVGIGGDSMTMKAGEKTRTQLYIENMQFEDAVSRERGQRQMLEKIVQELEQELDEVRKIQVHEKEVHEEDKKLMEKVMGERNRLVMKTQELRQQLEKNRYLLKENREMKQENKDLARQVRRLVREIEEAKQGRMIDSGEQTNTDSETETEMEVGTEGRGEGERERERDVVMQVINKKLITFKDITELQTQNQRLIRATRELAERIQQQQEENMQKWEEDEAQAIKTAQQTIEKLTEKIRSLNNHIDRLEAEKQSIAAKEMMENKSREDNEKAVHEDEIEQEYERYKAETEGVRQMQEREISALRAQNSEDRVKLAHMTARYDVVQQQLEQTQSDFSARGREIERLRETNTRLVMQVEEYERQHSQLRQNEAEMRGQIDKLRGEVAAAKVEKEVLNRVQHKWQEDMERGRQEREGINVILQNTSRMRDELREQAEKRIQEATDRLKLTEQLLLSEKNKKEELETRYSSVTNRMNVLEEESKTLKADYARRMGEYTEQVNKLLGVGDELEARNRELDEELKKLKQQLASEKQEVQRLVQLGENMTDAERIKNLEYVIKQQIQAHTTELEAEKCRAKTNEQRVVQLQKLLEDLEGNIKILKATNNSLQTNTIELKQQLENVNKQLVEKDAQVEEHQRLLKTAKDELERYKVEHNGLKQQFDEAQRRLAEEAEQQRQLAQERLERYELELGRHSRAVEVANELKKQMRDIQTQMQEQSNLSEQLKMDYQVLQAQKEKQEQVFKTREQEQENRITELTQQNDSLLSIIQVDKPNKDGGVGGGEREIKQVVAFQRQEKEVYMAKAQVLELEVQRWKSVAETAQRALDQTRAELLSFSSAKTSEGSRSGGAGEEQPRSVSYNEYRAKVDEAVLLKESNILLRQQLSEYKGKLEQIEKQLEKTKASISQFELKNASFMAELEAKNQEIALLTESNERWQKRNQSILAKYDRIDPNEHQSLQQQVADLTKALTERTQELTNLNAVIASQTSQLNETNAKLAESNENNSQAVALLQEKLREQGTTWKQRFDTLRNQSLEKLKMRSEKIQELSNEINELKTMITPVESSANDAEHASNTAAELEQLKSQLVDLNQTYSICKNENETLKVQVSALQTELSSVTSALEQVKLSTLAGEGNANANTNINTNTNADVDITMENVAKLKVDSFVQTDELTAVPTVEECVQTDAISDTELSGPPVAASDEYKEKYSQLQTEYKNSQDMWQKEIAEYSATVSKSKQLYEKLKVTALSNVNKLNINHKLQIEKLQSRINELEQQLQQLQQQIAAKNASASGGSGGAIDLQKEKEKIERELEMRYKLKMGLKDSQIQNLNKRIQEFQKGTASTASTASAPLSLSAVQSAFASSSASASTSTLAPSSLAIFGNTNNANNNTVAGAGASTGTGTGTNNSNNGGDDGEKVGPNSLKRMKPS